MPWTSENVAEQRLKLVRSILGGELSISQASRSKGVSRKTIYKWIERYQEQGGQGLGDRKRARHHQSVKIDRALWTDILRFKSKYPTWGGEKIHSLLPKGSCSVRTLERALATAGLTTRRKRSRLPGPRINRAAYLTVPQKPNEVWTVDFKGWFRTADGSRCDPLTVKDLYSRFCLGVKLVKKQNDESVRRAFVDLFRRWGMPKIIRVDNGPPFASSSGPYGWSRLSLWWSRLGITVQTTRPAKPQDNGSHEQFHRVYKAETLQTRAANPRAQQIRSGKCVQTYNFYRPHKSLANRKPAEFYRRSRRRYRPVKSNPSYPSNWKKVRVTAKGYIRHQGRIRLLSRILCHLTVGLRPVRPGVWEVYIDRILVGCLYDKDLAGMRPATYLKSQKVSPM